MANSRTAIFTTTDFGDYNASMRLIQNTAIPEAVAQTLNITADLVTKDQIKNVKDFIVRTPFTLRSMTSGRAKPYKALNKAKGKNLKTMFSRAGTISPYLWLQEENNTIEGLDGGPVPIATKSARISKSERRAISKKNRINRHQSLNPGTFGDDGKQFIARIRGKMGLWKRMTNGLIMLRNLNNDSVKITGTHFHEKAVKRKGSDALIAQRFKRIGQRRINRAVR